MTLTADTRDPVDFAALLPGAVRAALKTQRWEDFLVWIRAALPAYSSPELGLPERPDLERALAFALARSVWNALPLPRLGFVPEPVPEPGRNERCPCGSGEKYKRCCAGAPPLGGISSALLWPELLRTLAPAERAAALASRQVPRAGLLEFARDELDGGRAASAVKLLEPFFVPEVRDDDEIAAAMLLALCDAYEAQRGGNARKRALLERVTALPARSQLRSDAWQRLACIRMDSGHSASAWEAFRHAQQDQPTDPALGMLEVQLLMGEGKSGLARERARFHRAQLRRRGDVEEPKLLEFYDALARDPAQAMAAVAMDIEGGAGKRLAAWLASVRDRTLPRYRIAQEVPAADAAELKTALRERLRQMGVRGPALDRAVKDLEQQLSTMQPEAGTAAPDHQRTLQTPDKLRRLYASWRGVFALDKPFSVQPLPFESGNAWEPGAEAQWSGFLESHPECYDSFDILDDLGTAVALHPQGNQPWLQEHLALPLLERAVAMLDAALADAPDAELHWPFTDHRPALRALVRLADLETDLGHDERAIALNERLLRLNPGDNHGIRYRLAVDYLQRDDTAACLRLAGQFADDPAPELRFNEALAHYRRGEIKSAGAALKRAHRHIPRVARFLLPARVRRPKLSAVGVSLDGDDRAWVYRDAMRALWQRTPGALQWAAKVLGPGAMRG